MCAILVAFGMRPSVMARTLCVSSAGDGTDGLTWATAFVTPNAALSAAADADEIRLAKGTYVLTTTAELSGRTGVTISGGWDPSTDTREALSQSALTSAETFNGRLLTLTSVTDCRIEGVAFTNAFHYTETGVAMGGAVYATNAVRLALVDCSFRDNSAYSHAAPTDRTASAVPDASCCALGGALCLDICPNATGQYAGSFAAGVLAAPVPTKYAFCSDVFRNCLIADNVSDGMDKRTSAKGYVALGVGTSSRYGGSIRVENCTVAGNRFKDMSAAYATNTVQAAFKVDTKVSLTNTIFWGESDHTDVRMHQDNFKSAALSVPAVNCLFRNDAGTASVDCLTGGTSPFKNRKGTPYALARGASAVDRGVAVGYGVKTETDYAGNPRLSGAAIDIGCYELQPPDGTVVLIQ